MHHDITDEDERSVSDSDTSQMSVCLSSLVLDFAQVEFGDVRRAEGAQVQAPVVLVGLADVGCHQAIGVVEAASADAAVMELRHQTVPRDKFHQDLLTEELERREQRK